MLGLNITGEVWVVLLVLNSFLKIKQYKKKYQEQGPQQGQDSGLQRAKPPDNARRVKELHWYTIIIMY